MGGKIKLAITTISISLYTLNMSAQEIWSLKDCIERAIDKNISIKQAELDLDIIKQNKNIAIGEFLPTFNLNSSHSWNTGLTQNITTGILENMTTQSGSINANIGLDLFKGLQNIHQLYRTNLNILSSRYQLADMKDDISLLVANSYLQILFNKESLGIQKSQLSIANEELIIAKERLKSGIIPEGDVLEIVANVATMNQRVVVAENNYLLSKISLAQLLLITDISNFQISEPIDIIQDSSILNRPVQKIYEVALSKRNNIKLAKNNLLIAKKDLSISKSALYPTLTGFYSYNSRVLFDSEDSFSNQLDINAGETFVVQLSIPIFNGMNNNANIKRSKLGVKKSEYALNQIKLDLENTINQAYTDANGSLKAYEAAEKTLLARKLAYEYAKERFNNGVMNTFNFLQAQQSYETAQSELIKTKYDYIFKLKVLEFYFGETNIF